MNKNDVFIKISQHIESVKAISDHDHHLEDSNYQSRWSLEKILSNSYVSWMNSNWGTTLQSRKNFLDSISYNSYFTWLEKAIKLIHEWDDDITPNNWELISDRIRSNYSDHHFHLKLLRSYFDKLIVDCYWNPGKDYHHPDLFIPSFRIDKFMYGYHSSSIAPDNFSPWNEYNFNGNTLNDYIDNMKNILIKAHSKGRVKAFKCAEAYKRSLLFLPDDKKAAEDIFGKHPQNTSRDEEILFGNYIFNRCCEIADEMSIPFQIHTGLGDLSYSDPLKFLPTLKKYPGVKFILFHSGFPWFHSISGIIHNHHNAIASLTWTPSISTEAAISALDEYVDVSPSIHHISWGSDSWTTEESIGGLLAWRHVIATVITKRIVQRNLPISKGEKLAELLLAENNKIIYSL